MTFSIVARDERTGAFGVATATGGPNVGNLVPHARALVGAVATQGYTTNPLYGIDGLDLMATDKSAELVLEHLVDNDLGRLRRQSIMIDRNGDTAGWSGDGLGHWAGHICEQNFAVAGNLLAGQNVLSAMIDSFCTNTDLPLEDRLLSAMTAGQEAGGDKRGTQSAALKVYTTEPYAKVNLRVDLSQTPMADLKKVLNAVREPEFQTFSDRLPTRDNPGSA